ncbi:MAG: hypothetical protein ACMUIU_18385 [bacterium]
MKTRNRKLSLLVIFLTLCFIIYAGNCYSQVSSFLDTNYSWNQWDIGYPFGIGYSSLQSLNYLSGFPFYYWIQPGGKATLDLLLATVPNLNITYEAFYGVEHKSTMVALDFEYNYNRFPSPFLDNLNVYQNPDIYALPLSQRHTLYNFTQNFQFQPIMPDIWVGYGASYGGMGMSGMPVI